MSPEHWDGHRIAQISERLRLEVTSGDHLIRWDQLRLGYSGVYLVQF